MSPNKTYVIAKAGINHNRFPGNGKITVDAAITAKANAVKLQAFRAEALVSRFARKADYQKETTGSESSQLDMSITPFLYRSHSIKFGYDYRPHLPMFRQTPWEFSYPGSCEDETHYTLFSMIRSSLSHPE